MIDDRREREEKRGVLIAAESKRSSMIESMNAQMIEQLRFVCHDNI